MKTKRPFNLAIRAVDTDNYEISIRGIIGEYIDYARWTISDTETDVLNELKQIPEGKKISVRINSRGGDVGLGLGIYNALARRKKDITTYNDGYAMSAASVIMLAGARRISPKASVWMIHRATGGIEGTGEEMRSYAEGMDVIDGMMAKVYAEVSGKKTAAEFEDMMDKTYWCDGEDAVELGLATETSDDEPDLDGDDDGDGQGQQAAFRKQFLARFEKTIPDNLRARFTGPQTPRAQAQGQPAPAGPAANQPKPTQKISMKRIIVALVAAGFSIAADAEEDAVLPHINALVTDRANLKAANEKHETALKNRVTKKVEKAIEDKLIKAERKEALIKAGIADESTLEFIDDIRAEAAARQPRGARPAARQEGQEGEDVEAQIEANEETIFSRKTSATERSKTCKASLKLRGLDGIVKKPEETRAQN